MLARLFDINLISIKTKVKETHTVFYHLVSSFKIGTQFLLNCVNDFMSLIMSVMSMKMKVNLAQMQYHPQIRHTTAILHKLGETDLNRYRVLDLDLDSVSSKVREDITLLGVTCIISMSLSCH